MLDWRGDYGFLKVNSKGVYGRQYFEKYQGYAQTELGKKINDFRRGFVDTFIEPLGARVIDVGIGCGQFVESRPNTYGYDVNPHGIKWLKDRGLWMDPYRVVVNSLTFWDSLEHIENPWLIFPHASHHVFCSIPIFRDREHALSSKHYRPDEHYWYFTEKGFLRVMSDAGFKLLHVCDNETKLGREDIYSFAFRKR